MIENKIRKNVLLKRYSTFGTGGRAKYLVTIRNFKEAIELSSFIRKESIPFWVLGRGSNSIFDDRGFDGLIVLNRIRFIRFESSMAYVGAGFPISLLSSISYKKKLSGLGFASGIPGTVGGAIYINASAIKIEMKDILLSVKYIDIDRGLIEKKKEELKFSYRSSSFKEMNVIIVSCKLKLSFMVKPEDDPKLIIKKRMESQPYLDEKSAGCIFLNPKGISAGNLIDRCGLKGKEVGGAYISRKHANFIINRGNATSNNILQLIRYTKKIVKKKTNITLKPEIDIVPYKLN